jgi:hypothetical protein
VKNLIAAIEIFIDGWNDPCEPFVWTKQPTRSLRTGVSRHPQFQRIAACCAGRSCRRLRTVCRLGNRARSWRRKAPNSCQRLRTRNR